MTEVCTGQFSSVSFAFLITSSGRPNSTVHDYLTLFTPFGYPPLLASIQNFQLKETENILYHRNSLEQDSGDIDGKSGVRSSARNNVHHCMFCVLVRITLAAYLPSPLKLERTKDLLSSLSREYIKCVRVLLFCNIIRTHLLIKQSAQQSPASQLSNTYSNPYPTVNSNKLYALVSSAPSNLDGNLVQGMTMRNIRIARLRGSNK